MKRYASDKRDGWYTITPEDAMKALKDSIKNRPLSERYSQAIADEIKAGRWAANGESIIFDSQGRLLDGQHRMRAIVLANLPVEAHCVYNVEPKHFATMDQGRSRDGSNIAAIREMKYYTVVASIAKLAIVTDDGKNIRTNQGPQKVWGWQFDDYLKKNKEALERSAAVVSQFNRSWKKFVPISHVGFVHYIGQNLNAARAYSFVEGLATGINLGVESPVLQVRNRLLQPGGKSLSSSNVAIPTGVKLKLLVKAWNMHVLGQKKVLVLKESESVAFVTSMKDKDANGHATTAA